VIFRDAQTLEGQEISVSCKSPLNGGLLLCLGSERLLDCDDRDGREARTENVVGVFLL